MDIEQIIKLFDRWSLLYQQDSPKMVPPSKTSSGKWYCFVDPWYIGDKRIKAELFEDDNPNVARMYMAFHLMEQAPEISEAIS